MPFDTNGSDAGILCPVCRQLFAPRRKNQTYCCSRCRKEKYQRDNRSENPQNAAKSTSVRWTQYVAYQRALDIAEMLYTLPPGQRLGFMKNIIEAAKSGTDATLRSILTNPDFLRATRSDKHLFYRRCPQSYSTISQAANGYAKRFFGMGIVTFLKASALDLETGEVV